MSVDFLVLALVSVEVWIYSRRQYVFNVRETSFKANCQTGGENLKDTT